MGSIGGPEVLVILVVALLVFGPKSIPGIARTVGKSMRELRKLTTEFQREINLSVDEDEPRLPRRAPAPKESAGAPAPSAPEGTPAASSAPGGAPPGEAGSPAAHGAEPGATDDAAPR